MARLTLVVQPDGKAVLCSAQPLAGVEVEYLRDAVRGWTAGEWPVLVLSGCDVVQIQEFTVDLERPLPLAVVAHVGPMPASEVSGG